MFVYRLVTSIDTIFVCSRTFVRSMKLMKSVVSLRYDSCFFCYGLKETVNECRQPFCWAPTARNYWSSDQCCFVDFCKGVELWYPGRVLCLRKPFVCHFVNVFCVVQFWDETLCLIQCAFHHSVFEGFVALCIVKQDLSLLHFVLFVHYDGCGALVGLFEHYGVIAAQLVKSLFLSMGQVLFWLFNVDFR